MGMVGFGEVMGCLDGCMYERRDETKDRGMTMAGKRRRW